MYIIGIFSVGAVSSGMNVSGTILFLRNSEVRQKRSGLSKSARLAKTAAAQVMFICTSVNF